MSKKILAILIALGVAIVSAVTALVIVLVANSSYARSNVSVNYVATDVECTVSARYGMINMINPDISINGNGGTFSYKPMYKADGTTSTLEITMDNLSGELSPTADITLDKDGSRIILAYKFVNKMSNNPIYLELTDFPDSTVEGEANEGVDFLYYTSYMSESEIFLSYYDDVLYSSLGKVAIPAGQTKYVYIIVTVSDLLISAEFAGNIEWTLTRGENPTITGVSNTNTTLTMSNIYDGCTITEADLNHSTVNVRVGDWYTESSLSSKVTFPLTTDNTTLYADFLMGNIAEGNLTYNEANNYYTINYGTALIVDSTSTVQGGGYAPVKSTDTTLVIPDIFLGSNGKLAPIITLTGAGNDFVTNTSLLSNNTHITTLYVGNNITATWENYAYNSALTTVYMGEGIREMYGFRYNYDSTNITNIYLKSGTVTDWSYTDLCMYWEDKTEYSMADSSYVATCLNSMLTGCSMGFCRYQNKCTWADYDVLNQEGLV